MSIKKLALALYQEYDTRNPFTVCEILGITIVFTQLKGTRGFFHRAYGTDTLYIDENLPEYVQVFICAHELGHAFLHGGVNAVYMDTRTFQVIGKYENAANHFAAFLLWPDDDELLEYVDYTWEQLSALMGMPEETVKWRYEQIDPVCWKEEDGW